MGFHSRKKLKIQLVLTIAPLAKHNPKPKTQTKYGYHFHTFHGYKYEPETQFASIAITNHTSTATIFSMELWAEPKSSLLGFDSIPDTDISAGRCRPGSVNENVLIRTCVDDVGCDIDDGGPLRIGSFCILATPSPTRMRINVGAMPCVILEDN
jgi:hypothetical protein